jgi:hypothetical protein
MTYVKQIAETILAQLGGNRFVAMTGARSFSSGIMRDKQPGLSFRLSRCKDGIQSCIITLAPDDLYDIEFGRMVKHDYKVVKSHEGVYVENLRRLFTEATGLETSL